MQKIIASISILLVLLMAAPQSARAGVWGESISAEIMGQVWEQLQKSIEGILLSTLRQTALQMLNSQIGQALGGGQYGNPLFVVSWDDELFLGPLKENSVYMNNLLTQTLRGRGSTLNYIPAEVASTFGGNYYDYLQKQAKAAIGSANAAASAPTTTITRDPRTAAAEGDVKNFFKAFDSPYNNPLGLPLVMQAMQAEDLARRKEQAATRAIAYQGYKCKSDSGFCITPGSTLKDLQSNVSATYNNLITAAQNPYELVTGVATTLITRSVTNLVQKGIGSVQQKFLREFYRLDNKVGGTLRDINQYAGAAAQYSAEARNISAGLAAGSQGNGSGSQVPPPIAGCAAGGVCGP